MRIFGRPSSNCWIGFKRIGDREFPELWVLFRRANLLMPAGAEWSWVRVPFTTAILSAEEKARDILDTSSRSEWKCVVEFDALLGAVMEAYEALKSCDESYHTAR